MPDDFDDFGDFGVGRLTSSRIPSFFHVRRLDLPGAGLGLAISPERAETLVRSIPVERRQQVCQSIGEDWAKLGWEAKLQLFEVEDVPSNAQLTHEEIMIMRRRMQARARPAVASARPGVNAPPPLEVGHGPSYLSCASPSPSSNSSRCSYSSSTTQLSHRGALRRSPPSRNAGSFQAPHPKPVARSRSFSSPRSRACASTRSSDSFAAMGAELGTPCTLPGERVLLTRTDSSPDYRPYGIDHNAPPLSASPRSSGGRWCSSTPTASGHIPIQASSPSPRPAMPEALSEQLSVASLASLGGSSCPPTAPSASPSRASTQSNAWVSVPSYARFTQSYAIHRSVGFNEREVAMAPTNALLARAATLREQSDAEDMRRQLRREREDELVALAHAARWTELISHGASEYDRQFLPAGYADDATYIGMMQSLGLTEHGALYAAAHADPAHGYHRNEDYAGEHGV